MSSKITKILKGIFIFFGSLIILLATLIVYLLFFSKSINPDEMTSSLDDFLFAYENNTYESDLPMGLYTESSICEISSDGKTFTYTLVLYNANTTANQVIANFYLNEDYIDNYGDNVTNPFFRITSNDEVYTTAESYSTFTYTGIILNSSDEDSSEVFMECFETIYLEISYGDEVKRVMLSVEFE